MKVVLLLAIATLVFATDYVHFANLEDSSFVRNPSPEYSLPTYYKQNGIVYLDGELYKASSGRVSMGSSVIFHLPADYAPNTPQIFTVAATHGEFDEASLRVSIINTEVRLFFGDGMYGWSGGFVSLSGISFTTTNSSKVYPTVHQPWTTKYFATPNYSTPSVYSEGNIVHLDGIVSIPYGTSLTVDLPIFNLPQGYEASSENTFLVAGEGENLPALRLVVDNNVVYLEKGQSWSGGYLSLSGVKFRSSA
jgi:hypothetical protein